MAGPRSGTSPYDISLSTPSFPRQGYSNANITWLEVVAQQFTTHVKEEICAK